MVLLVSVVGQARYLTHMILPWFSLVDEHIWTIVNVMIAMVVASVVIAFFIEL